MFPSGSGGSNGGGGGGVERSHPTRGSAHPYLDSASPSTGPALFPSYAARLDADRPNDPNDADDIDNGDDDATRFQEEDRMLLRLLYHQQQAIQVQLNTMMEWMQQVNFRLAAVERRMRTSRSATSTAAPSGEAASASTGAGPRSYAAPPTSRSVSAMEDHAPMSNPHLSSHQRPTASSELVSAEVPHAHPSGPGSTYSGQSHLASSTLAVSSVLEGSRACTPPSEQTRHHLGGGAGGGGGGSAIPSTTRSSESALAAPWDPHNASQQSAAAATHSRSSSHTSALGRRANPLLNSSGVRSTLQAPTAAAARQQLSRLDTSGLSGTEAAPSTNVSAEALPVQPRQPPVVSPPLTAADAVVPPYRRVSADYAAAVPTRQPLSRVSAGTRHAPPTSTLADVEEAKRGGRERTLPPPPQRSAATSSVQDNTQNGSTTREPASSRAAAPPGPPPPTHADPTATTGEGGEGTSREGKAAPRRVVADDDSLSDGYGSYESRMYMKNLGLL